MTKPLISRAVPYNVFYYLSEGDIMTSRTAPALIAASLLFAPCLTSVARADNPMGYQVLSQQEAASLPHNHGALGLDIERAQEVSEPGMMFDIIRIKQVRRGSAGAQAGFKPGDQIIAVDGHVFPTLVAFSDYIGSMPPGSRMTVDYMPAGSGPQQAQRIAVMVGQAGQPSATQPAPHTSTGMSTGEKVAIGAGAVALLGCYEMGCFSHHANPNPNQQPVQQPNTIQPR